MYYIALFASIGANTMSLVLLKQIAVRSGSSSRISGTTRSGWSVVFDPKLLLAVALYGFAAIAWMVALFGVDLVVAYPMLATTYVAIGVLAPRLFSEEITGNKWIGILAICVGVVVLNL